MENGERTVVDDLSSPPSSLSDHSPHRSEPHSANHAPGSTHDTPSFGVASASPQNGNYAQSSPALANATAAASPSGSDAKLKRPTTVTLPDGTVRLRRKPGPKPKPKDPNAPEKPKRKRQKVAEAPTSAPQQDHAYQQQQQQQQQPLQPQQPAARQSKITDLVNQIPPPTAPRASSEHYHVTPSPAPQVAQLGATPSTPRPASSGQHFDPIRGEMSSRPSTVPHSPTATSHPPPSLSGSRLVPSTSVNSAPVSPVPPHMAKPLQSAYAPSPPNIPQRASTAAPPAPSTTLPSSEMDIDHNNKVSKHENGLAGPPSNAPTPPPQKRAKEQPPPLPTGSGLLSGTPLGGIGAASNSNGVTGTNIYLTFALSGQNNVTINFAREVEKRYGFAALHPRLAARKERQRQIANASNALEKAAGLGSADEMSLDISEPDSANEDNAPGDDTSNAQPGDGKKRRKRRAEDYDRGDEFIDDTEMAWEESALMAKDGFFVYSGPLMSENEKTQAIERADGTVKRGRGRGRGGSTRGDASGRGRGGGAAAGAGAGGGGRGSRGGATVRKPRVTKADRAAMEQEKMDREKMAAQLAVKQAPQQQQQQQLPYTSLVSTS